MPLKVNFRIGSEWAMASSRNSEPSLPHPADFPLGSPASRAAARLWFQRLYDSHERMELVIVGIGLRGDDKPHASPWTEGSDGKMFRTLFVPSGMTEEEARRVLDGRAE